MILKILLLCLVLAPLTSPVQAQIWENITGYIKGESPPESPAIRIRLVHGVDEVQLGVRGKYSLFDPRTNERMSRRLAGKSRSIQALGDGLKWGETFPGLYQIKIRPDSAETILLVDGGEYEGIMYVYDIQGKISVVNEIPVESYTHAALDAYQYLDLEKETWAALAIAIRTYTYFEATHPKNAYWTVDAQEVSYKGITSTSPPIDDAMRQTRYMILSRTGIYEGTATPFPAQFNGPDGRYPKSGELSKISLEEANAMAKKGAHAAQILAKAFPGSTIMLMPY